MQRVARGRGGDGVDTGILDGGVSAGGLLSLAIAVGSGLSFLRCGLALVFEPGRLVGAHRCVQVLARTHRCIQVLARRCCLRRQYGRGRGWLTGPGCAEGWICATGCTDYACAEEQECNEQSGYDQLGVAPSMWMGVHGHLILQ
ncbi:hypothetical protein [Methanosphaerula palustris]|uniref:hypothetical protein n=1 Tax=Methanosphaerula palustris TaxID=475088 RepID=UPI0011D16523|nr:hypothetical protein [Methanosphaerula palustris]